MKKVIMVILLLLIGGLGGFLFLRTQVTPSFNKLSSGEKWQRIIQERDEAIKGAVRDGVYKCCIEPPCTMCYMEANQWNNYQAGTCACDELIAEGKEPCPQCERGLCQGKGACNGEELP